MTDATRRLARRQLPRLVRHDDGRVCPIERMIETIAIDLDGDADVQRLVRYRIAHDG